LGYHTIFQSKEYVMPANSLQVKSRKFTKFNAQRDQDVVTVNGEYTIAVVNKGILPAPSVSISITSLKSSGITIIEEKSKTIGSVSSGQEAQASFEFSYEATISEFESKVCEGQTVEVNAKEMISGILLAITFDEAVEVKPQSPTCDISEVGEPAEPEPPDDEEGDEEDDQEDDGDGVDIGGPGDPEDDPETEPDPEPDPEPEPPDPVELTIDGATEPLEDLDNTYDVEDDPDSAVEYRWTMPEGDAFDERVTEEDEITVVFEDPQYFTIEVESLNDEGQVNGEGSIQGRVLDQFGAGTGDEEDDTPPPRDASDIPSLSEAADDKSVDGW
jgi:hypothetical protein